jgi:cytochrome c553
MGNMFAYIICLIITLSAAQVSAAGDPSAGAQKVQTCSVCHGLNGNSVNPVWPKLAGQHAEYTLKQLQGFKNGGRANPQMTPMASALSDQDMQDIAAYYAGQSLQQTPVPASVDTVTIALGETIYRAGDARSGLPACMACHGPAGSGNPAALYPGLAGQHSAYTSAQLQAFKTETRNNDANSMMRNIAGRMSNEEIEAVSLYIQGLAPAIPAE